MPEYPSEALIASIQHQAEKLGYLVAQVEEIFSNHARHDRHEVTVSHAMKSGENTKLWLAGEIKDDYMAQLSANLLLETSDRYDEIKAVHQANINRLNEMVVEAIARGKGQQDELNKALGAILNEGEQNV